jgi:hypothetical protein
MLGSACAEVVLSGSRLLAVTDVRLAAERLRQVVETGALRLEPARRRCGGTRKECRREPMVAVSFCVPAGWAERLDRLVALGVYSSRAEAVRDALKRLIEQYRDVR